MDDLVRALKVFYDHMKNFSVNWVIIGSMGLALQGVDIVPHDIDILTDDEGALLIHRELAEFESKPLKMKKSKLFRSVLGALEINGVEIEIMADLEVNARGRWTRKAFARTILTFEGMELPVYSLEASLEAYKTMNREKDQIKIKKIKEALKKL